MSLFEMIAPTAIAPAQLRAIPTVIRHQVTNVHDVPEGVSPEVHAAAIRQQNLFDDYLAACETADVINGALPHMAYKLGEHCLTRDDALTARAAHKAAKGKRYDAARGGKSPEATDEKAVKARQNAIDKDWSRFVQRFNGYCKEKAIKDAKGEVRTFPDTTSQDPKDVAEAARKKASREAAKLKAAKKTVTESGATVTEKDAPSADRPPIRTTVPEAAIRMLEDILATTDGYKAFADLHRACMASVPQAPAKDMGDVEDVTPNDVPNPVEGEAPALPWPKADDVTGEQEQEEEEEEEEKPAPKKQNRKARRSA